MIKFSKFVIVLAVIYELTVSILLGAGKIGFKNYLLNSIVAISIIIAQGIYMKRNK